MRTKTNKTRISQRITGYLKEIQSEALGIEKKVKSSIHQYVLEQGGRYQKPPDKLIVSIQYPNDKLHIQLFQQRELLAILKTADLVYFFSGGMVSIPEMEQKTVEKVTTYFHDLAAKHTVSPHQLEIQISAPGELVSIQLRIGEEVKEQIPIKELIQYFR